MKPSDIHDAVNKLYWDEEQHHYNLDDETLKVIDNIVSYLKVRE